ncbi:hypothetical protein DSO57_1004737 [Entomophthora muscae]|uniref:Uncharacterized protein n=1 Tax=Entomophthora muscae TaxID=34485 RepID=A0ACC2TK14_9FUNG|nr:hypothetical protein DSO57_1004737 [Entomophthora muscae]
MFTFITWFQGAALVALLHHALAIPSFHKVNGVFVDGSTCPLQSIFNQECPQLCVRDTKSCPQGTLKTCEVGTTLCQDGGCHSSCDGLINPCACGLSSYNYVPCGNLVRSNVNHFMPEFRMENITSSCSNTLKIPAGSFESWTEIPTKPNVWLVCPAPPEPTFTLKEPMFLAAYGIAAIQAILFCLWHLFKQYIEKSVPRPPAPTAKSKEGQVELRFEGYRNNMFGSLLYFNVYLVTLAWFILLAIIVADNYGAIGKEAFYIFLSSTLVSKTFVVVWYLASIWLAVLFLSKGRVRNYFRLRCFFKQAEVVQIEKHPDNVILSSSASAWLVAFKNFLHSISALLGTNLIVKTVSIYTLPSECRYFEFQCVRYINNAGEFAPSSSPIPNSPAELMELSDGLSTSESLRRQELFGPNIITVQVASFFTALTDELSTFPYLYQMMFLWIWYFFTYYQMALVQTVVIIISALIQVIIRIRSEEQIRGLAEITAEIEVQRDGQWATLSSVELVPGDVFRVEVGQPVPCDAVLLSGEVIVDESMLTGEAMPVRKLPLNKDSATYFPSPGPGHSLVSGTTVLQGGGECGALYRHRDQY